MRKKEARLTLWVLSRIAVTIARLPPPPRNAQNRSSSPSTRRRLASAVTTSKLVTRSSVSPNARPASPIPPPRTRPPTPTVGQLPAGGVRSLAAGGRAGFHVRRAGGGGGR